MPELTIWVPGIPQPQGSTRAFKTKGGKVVTTSANAKLRPWRHALCWELQAKRKGAEALSREVALEVTFLFPRPAGHFKPSGALSNSARVAHTVKPDLDKLVRAVLDALTESGAVHDDSQVIQISARKSYAERHLNPGAAITVRSAQPRQQSQPSIPAQEQAHGSSAGIRRVVG